MKKILSGSLLLTLLAIGCIDNKTESEENNLHNLVKKENLKCDFAGYRNQLPYYKASSETEAAEEMAKLNYEEKINDKNTDWTYFDQLYNDSLSVYNKQKLAFTILSKKDLIGLVKQNSSDENLKNALKKYITILVDTKYFGYCVLFSSLELISDDTDFIDQKTNAISDYADLEKFHKNVLEQGDDFPDKEVFLKIEEDYSYLSRIKAL
ncbi:hypothetical protein [Flavobacterium sp.]|uniref:hypothetical protein n=1 Tax=Flavobacterium sp. TaxID=239 RepID=UPI003D6ACA2C